MSRSVVLNWTGLLLRMGTGFALLPFILRNVGASHYGYYLLLISIFGYGRVLDLGFNAVVIRYVARHTATRQIDALNRILGVVFSFYTLLSLTIASIILLFALRPQPWMIPEGAPPNFRLLIILAGSSTAIMFHQLGWTSVIRARERFDLSNYIQISGLILRTSLIVIFLPKGLGIAVVLSADLAEVIFNGIIHRLTARHLFPEMHPSYFGFHRSDIREVASYGIWVSFNSLSQQIRYRTHSIIIAAFMPAAAITHYGVAGRMQSYLVNFTNNMTTVIRARFSYLEGLSDWAQIQELYLRSLRLVSAIAITLTGVLFLEANDFFAAWLGSEYIRSGLYMRILLPGIAADMTMTVCIVLVYGIGRHKTLTYILLAEAVSILGSTIFLIHPLGLVGVALGTSASMLFFKGIVLPLYASSTIGMNNTLWFRKGLLPSLRILPLAFAAGMAIRYYWFAGNLLIVILRGAVLTVPFILLVWKYVLRREDRAILSRYVRRIAKWSRR